MLLELGDYEFVLANKDRLLTYGSVIIRGELREIDMEATVTFQEQTRKLRILLFVNAYALVNDLHNLPTPDFRSYNDFVQELKKPLWRQRKCKCK